MKSKSGLKRLARTKRRRRVRKKIFGDPGRPRLAVFRSLKHMTAQIVDDESGKTLVQATTTSKSFRNGTGEAKGKTAMSAELGKVLANQAIEKGIKAVRFEPTLLKQGN